VSYAALAAKPAEPAPNEAVRPAPPLDASPWDLGLGHGLDDRELGRLREVAVGRVVKRLGHLYRSGDAFRSVYVLASGLMKRVALSAHGREHMVGIGFPGNLLGFEGIDSGVHSCDVIALQDSAVWGISYARLTSLARELPTLGHDIHRAMSQQIVIGNRLKMLLGSMRARERVVTLLLTYVRHARSSDAGTSEFDLRITREEIGSFLGLRLETVSRELGKLTEMGLLRLNRSRVEVPNVDRLAAIAGLNSIDRYGLDCAGPGTSGPRGAGLLALIGASGKTGVPRKSFAIEPPEHRKTVPAETEY
jgi:CRP/FNR family transcriptional regulator, anaerobic regulatory protein